MTVDPRFRRTSYEAIDWRRVERLTIVPFLHGGSVVLDAEAGGRRLVEGALQENEHPLAVAPMRLALEQCGFRRQGTHPFAIAGRGDNVALWCDGARYRGTRAHRRDAPWWTGDAASASEQLRAVGAPHAAALVEMAEDARRSLTDDQYWADSQRVLDAAYLAADTPEGGSGFGGTAQEWFEVRSVLCDAVDRDGSFLDAACANGHLMESIVQWCAAGGVHVEPYGVDISEPLVALARRRLPQWADRIWTGNVLTWVPPDGRRFDYVHSLFDCVPDARRGDLVQHLLDVAVAPGGRLIMSNYGAGPDQRAALLLERLGFAVAGETRPSAGEGRDHQPSAWIDLP